MNVAEENIAPEAVKQVEISFKVWRSWTVRKDIDPRTIYLCRFAAEENKWESLPTKMVGKDEEYFYYTATSPGLSIFAIAGGPAPWAVISSIVSAVPWIIVGSIISAVIAAAVGAWLWLRA